VAGDPVIPSAFDVRRPDTVEEAVALLAADGDAKALAGGHSLVPLMKLRLAAPSTLVDLARLDALRGIREEGGELVVGALTRHAELERSELVRARCPLLAEVAATIGDMHVRNRGTIGGSLAHGDAKADLPAAAVALDARLVLVGAAGRRVVPAREFFLGFLTTALEQGELLTEVRVPAAPGARAAYEKFARRAQDWALVGCAAVVRGGAETVVWTGVAPTPALAGGDWRDAAAALEPADEVSGSAEYKRHLAVVLAERALARARA
jgi:carbon-monoxide dehydrogenase medium subunit